MMMVKSLEGVVVVSLGCSPFLPLSLPLGGLDPKVNAATTTTTHTILHPHPSTTPCSQHLDGRDGRADGGGGTGGGS